MSVTIDWLDHHGDTDQRWRTKGEILERSMEDVVIRSYGDVLYEDSDKIIIAAEIRLDKDLAQPLYRGYTVIYKKLVVNQEQWGIA